ACKGVLVRGRLTAQTLRPGASNVTIDGYGVVRRQKVYRARRTLSSPGLVSQSVAPPNAALSFSFGRGGRTGGPPILGLSRPETNRAWSRITSAALRKRGPRANSRLSGSRSSSAGVTRDDCRYVAEVTISRSSFFVSHPLTLP